MKKIEFDIRNKPSKIISFLLEKFAGYYDGELYRFVKVDNFLTLVPAKQGFIARLLIVAPYCYKERALSFPLEDRKELNKLLKLQLMQGETYLIQNSKDGQSKVNTWLFSEAVPNALIRFPESLLLGMSCQNGAILKVHSPNNKQTFIAQFDGVIHTAAMKGIINSADRFTTSVGLSLQQTDELKSEDRATALANSLQKIKYNRLPAFIKKSTPRNSKLMLAQVATPLVIIMTLYIFVTSFYLSLKVNLAENKLAKNTTQVSELLHLQTLVDSNQTNSQELSYFLQNRNNLAGLWVVMAPVFKQATIKSIVFQEGKILIRGQASKASSLLESISQNPNLTNAKFENPVRKNKNVETFNLSFKLTKKLVVGNSESIVTNEGFSNE